MKRSATPILDLKRPVPLPQGGMTLSGLVKAVPAAFGLIALFALVMFLVFTHQTYIPSWLATLGVSFGRTMDTIFSNGVLVAVVVSLGVPFLATLIHEAGHAAAAITLRWPVKEFRVAPFSIKREKDGWKLNVSWKLQPQAMVAAEPPQFARYHVKQAVFAAGGPAANLLSCALAALLDPGPHMPLGHAICCFFLAWSGFLGIFNLLPIHKGGLEVDGYSVFMVARSRQALAVRIASLRLRKHILTAKSLSSFNRRWMALAESSNNASQYNMAGLWLAYAYWSDQKQFDRAASLLEKMLRGCKANDVLFRALLFAECAIFWSVRGNSEAALAWNARTKDLFIPEHLRHRTNSYVAWVQGDKNSALKEAIAAREAAGKLEAQKQDSFISAWNQWIEALQADLLSQPTRTNVAGTD
ncbi:MAG TPA: hypothetical protein VFR24_16730 [Candidatus Angelobacter sp.]|nr:hypothetical protein [Candidatus Angelobacter sp.]